MISRQRLVRWWRARRVGADVIAFLWIQATTVAAAALVGACLLLLGQYSLADVLRITVHVTIVLVMFMTSVLIARLMFSYSEFFWTRDDIDDKG
jgi:hypothetical protein